MFTILDYSSALEYSIIRRYTNIVYYYYLAACDPNYFLAINRILVNFCTTPIGSGACERSFSELRRLKLWTRASMSEDRLSGLAMLHVYRNTDLIPKPELIYSRKSNWRYLLN